ncbi:activating signal cointegrator 1-like isoform B [Micractinium conductrix]|uniref:Activating signal cointegrator 1-like isoform B n=1 Tax=Micractinium conductrix TaxID=554055 RepID=A0A2P6V337_9CHLO|nr:activating signal cointegrator 1-like isoform B [Micractinium conductrix]|eukprot:PSC68487.1 activating signal cointegrator 1-like isoform B [Micractinium conductrix]
MAPFPLCCLTGLISAEAVGTAAAFCTGLASGGAVTAIPQISPLYTDPQAPVADLLADYKQRAEHSRKVQKKLVVGGLVAAAAAAGLNREKEAVVPLALSAALSAGSVLYTVLLVQPVNAKLKAAAEAAAAAQASPSKKGKNAGNNVEQEAATREALRSYATLSVGRTVIASLAFGSALCGVLLLKKHSRFRRPTWRRAAGLRGRGGLPDAEKVEAWDGLPEGLKAEVGSPHCFLCQRAQRLVVPQQLRGLPKVYPLEKKLVKAAQLGLKPAPNSQDLEWAAFGAPPAASAALPASQNKTKYQDSQQQRKRQSGAAPAGEGGGGNGHAAKTETCQSPRAAAASAAALPRAVVHQQAQQAQQARGRVWQAAPTTPSNKTEMLFVQTSDTLRVWQDRKTKLYTIRMGDANPLTIAFTNRPLHESAVVPNSKVIAALEPNVKNPVNAALVHATEKGEVAELVELISGSYNAKTGAITYKAKPLPTTHPYGGRVGHDTQGIKAGSWNTGAALFLDDCSDESRWCYCACDGVMVRVSETFNRCWNAGDMACEPCGRDPCPAACYNKCDKRRRKRTPPPLPQMLPPATTPM